jgi:hypothetical protein
MAGATAVGGGDLTVVVDVESVVLLAVESVTIGSTAHALVDTTTVNAAIIFLIFFAPRY